MRGGLGIGDSGYFRQRRRWELSLLTLKWRGKRDTSSRVDYLIVIDNYFFVNNGLLSQCQTFTHSYKLSCLPDSSTFYHSLKCFRGLKVVGRLMSSVKLAAVDPEQRLMTSTLGMAQSNIGQLQLLYFGIQFSITMLTSTVGMDMCDQSVPCCIGRLLFDLHH